MVSERDRDREAVRWELGDDSSSPPPSFNNNNGGLQLGTVCGTGAGTTSFIDDGATNIGVCGGSTGKEVRYAPFPVTSPTHSNEIPTSQVPLQRAHSR